MKNIFLKTKIFVWFLSLLCITVLTGCDNPAPVEEKYAPFITSGWSGSGEYEVADAKFTAEIKCVFEHDLKEADYRAVKLSITKESFLSGGSDNTPKKTTVAEVTLNELITGENLKDGVYVYEKEVAVPAEYFCNEYGYILLTSEISDRENLLNTNYGYIYYEKLNGKVNLGDWGFNYPDYSGTKEYLLEKGFDKNTGNTGESDVSELRRL